MSVVGLVPLRYLTTDFRSSRYGAVFPKTENPRRRIGTGLGHRLPGVAGVYNVYAYADEMREWLDRWAEHVAGIVAPRSKPVRAKGSLAWFLGLTGTLTEGW